MYKVVLFLSIAIVLGSMTILTNQALAQALSLPPFPSINNLPPFSSINNVKPTYLIDIIPGGENSGYVPKDIAIPVGTTVAWVNDDRGQSHTITSGLSNSTDNGNEFNSGMLSFSAFFIYTFNKPGLFNYHDVVNPSLTGSVYVSNASFTGQNFKLNSGSDMKAADGQYAWTLNKGKIDRNLFDIDPINFNLSPSTPLTYQVTLFQDTKPIVSRDFLSVGNVFQVELINSEINNTSIYGPDVIDPITGAYHIQAPLPDGIYTLKIQLTSIGFNAPEQEMSDEFKGRIIS